MVGSCSTTAANNVYQLLVKVLHYLTVIINDRPFFYTSFGMWSSELEDALKFATQAEAVDAASESIFRNEITIVEISDVSQN